MPSAENILVVGGTGVIGHFVVRRLAALGHRPVVLSPSGNTEFLVDLLDRITVLRGDMTDGALVDRIIKAQDISRIAHMAAIVHGIDEGNVAATARVMVEGTANILQAAARHGVRRVIYASSKGAYGPPTGRHAHPTYDKLSEDFPANPSSIYGILKLTTERLGRWFRDNKGLEFAALRFASTVGPGKLRRHGDTSLHSRMLESAMVGARVAIDKGGEAVTDVVYNDDVAQGVVGALFAQRLNHALYNIGTGTGITLHDFAAAVRRRFQGADIAIGPGIQYLRPDSAGHCILDISRAAADFGYQPDPDPDHMVANYVAMMKRLGLNPDVPAPPREPARA